MQTRCSTGFWVAFFGCGIAHLTGCGGTNSPSCTGSSCGGDSGVLAGGARHTGGSSPVEVPGAVAGVGAVTASVVASGGVESGNAGTNGATGLGGHAGPAATLTGTDTGGAAGSAGAGGPEAGGPGAGAGAGGTSGVSGGAATGGSAPGSPATGGALSAATGGVGGAVSEATGGSNASGGAAAGGGAVVAPPPEAILKYDFEEGSGTKVTDTSGNGNHGVLNGALWTAEGEGRNALGASFAAAGASVQLPNDLLANTSALTLGAWVYLEANEPQTRLFELGSGEGNSLYFVLNDGKNGMGMESVRTDDFPASITSRTQLPLRVWKHVAVTVSLKGGASIFVDGKEVMRNPQAGFNLASFNSTTTNLIGQSSQAGHPGLVGRVDEFYVYRGELPLSEIRKLAWPKRDYSIWHFDEAVGETVAKDSSDNQFDGQLLNGASWGKGVDGGALVLTNATGTGRALGQAVKLPRGVLKDCTAGYTFATWINISNSSIPHMRVFEFGNSDEHIVYGRTMGGWTSQWGFLHQMEPGRPQRAATINYLDATWPTNTWYHLAAVRDGQTVRMYINGAPTVPVGTMKDNSEPVYRIPDTAGLVGDTISNVIGGVGPSTTDASSFSGSIDEFLISCRPYTDPEIQQLRYRYAQ